ncbi:acyl-CoA thioesterase [Verrucomicrobiales bacterium]|nr:acyl-CoA thioesterase [Verrucomicrobiales bacterium]MDB4617601.1 acyl-CoA thioesterase [Verrucomicrobiales bacterium]MDC0291787.1 acyl-CoA thioesterase [Verrucomicrobiales bacterium]MDC0311830.1 acyl-CoA thioesterase [bacterium]
MNAEFSTFETALDVRPDDIDMNRHVHNSRYLDYVLAARFDQMERCYKMSMNDFLERGFSWYVKTTHIDHKRGLALGDKILVRTHVSEMRRHGVRVEFKIVKQSDQKISAKGYFDYVMVDAETGRPAIIPEDIAAAYSV